MKKHYELQKQLPDGQWMSMWRFATVEELNSNLERLLDGSNDMKYRGILYDGDMKVGWKDFQNKPHDCHLKLPTVVGER